MTTTEIGIVSTPAQIITFRGMLASSSIEYKVCFVLTQLGFKSNLSGFRYIMSAVKKVMSDKTYMSGITKRLYVDIAKDFKSSPSRVERAIRNCISSSNYVEPEICEMYLGNRNIVPGTLTNSELIGILVMLMEFNEYANNNGMEN